MPQEYDEASEVYKAEEVLGFVFIPCADAAESKQPSKEALHLPSTSVPAQRPAIGEASGHGTSWGYQLDVLRREVFLELLAVVRFVADELLGRFPGEALLKDLVDETYFVTFT